MKSSSKIRFFSLRFITCMVLTLFLFSGGAAFGVETGNLEKGDLTPDGLTVIKASRNTETQIKNGVVWSDYTKYQISPVDVSFRKNWKKDYNRDRRPLSARVTDKDMARIRKDMAEIVYEEFNEALRKEGGLTRVDEADSNTLLFKPMVINLDVYAPDVQHSSAITRNFMRQAGKATLFLEVHDAVSGEILGRWVDTREDSDNGYFEWANRITNMARVRVIVGGWARRLIEGLDDLRAVN